MNDEAITFKEPFRLRDQHHFLNLILAYKMFKLSQTRSLTMSAWFSICLLGMIFAPFLREPSKASPHSDLFCNEPNLGTYLIVSQGIKKNVPIGQLQLETWYVDGSLAGTRFSREGTKYSETPYIGRWKKVGNCDINISRADGGMDSNVILKSNGDPHFGIIGTPGVVASERWFPQSNTSCTKETIVGEVLSLQEGHQFKDGRWQSNRVIQRELWSGWKMSGVAMSSYSGKFEIAAYQGNFLQVNNCIGKIQQQDIYGVIYDYIAILRSDGKGYAYLQMQGNALTVAVLDQINSQ